MQASTRHDNQIKQQQVEQLLERASENLGDLTPRVLAEYYRRYPQAREAFAQNGFSRADRLEEDMVNSAVYCLMTWFERPVEVEITMRDSIPLHQFRNIPIDYVTGLQEVVCDVIAAALPNANDAEKALLAELKQSLVELFRDSLYSPGA
jgi:hypothetical protein